MENQISISKIIKTKLGNTHCRIIGTGKNKFFFYHGFPGSSLQGIFIEKYVDSLDISLCAFDRPGYGKTDFLLNYRHSDIASATQEIANALGWKKFHLVGVSAGGPYALASATNSGAISCSIIGALGPLYEKNFIQEYSLLFRFLLKTANLLPAGNIPIPTKFFGKTLRQLKNVNRSPILSKKDKEILSTPENQNKILLSLQEAFSQGIRGPHQDVKNFTKPWDLPSEAIKCPIFIWHGDEDKMVPPKFALLLEKRFPNASVEIVKGEGHYSLPIDKIEQIVSKAIKSG